MFNSEREFCIVSKSAKNIRKFKNEQNDNRFSENKNVLFFSKSIRNISFAKSYFSIFRYVVSICSFLTSKYLPLWDFPEV